MNENSPGTGFSNIAGGIGAILGGLGGGGGVGDIICNAKGNCVPKNVTYVQNQPNNPINPMFLLIGGVVIVVLLIVMLKK